MLKVALNTINLDFGFATYSCGVSDRVSKIHRSWKSEQTKAGYALEHVKKSWNSITTSISFFVFRNGHCTFQHLLRIVDF